jgi:hypothetical protein
VLCCAALHATRGPQPAADWNPCRKNLRGKEDMGDVLDVVEFAAAQLPGPDKQVAVIG